MIKGIIASLKKLFKPYKPNPPKYYPKLAERSIIATIQANLAIGRFEYSWS